MKIAVDGPAGSGKSTVAKLLAAELGLHYLDTGAMYRSIAYALINKNVDIDDKNAVENGVDDISLNVEYIDGVQKMFADGNDITDKIRTAQISMGASKVAVVKKVRDKLVTMQRAVANKYDIIMDGRDIGTTVLPDADYKFYITASSAERAKRRYAETQDKSSTSLEKIEAEIKQRDYNDMHREFSPLCKAEDAILIDTTHMTVEEVIDAIKASISNNE